MILFEKQAGSSFLFFRIEYIPLFLVVLFIHQKKNEGESLFHALFCFWSQSLRQADRQNAAAAALLYSLVSTSTLLIIQLSHITPNKTFYTNNVHRLLQCT